MESEIECPKCGSENIKKRSTFFGAYLSCRKCERSHFEDDFFELDTKKHVKVEDR